MIAYRVTFDLESDATFGRGDGVAGFIDREVEHDEHGLPFLRGRTLKGLLSEEADNLLFALCGGQEDRFPPKWREARHALFGSPGSDTGSGAVLHVGRAQLPEGLRETVALSGVSRSDVLDSLTAIRRQTAVREDGVPDDDTLRTMRVILRDTPFEARLQASRALTAVELALLAATVLAFHRAGMGRNRGRGRLRADLFGPDGSSWLREGYETFTREALA